VFSFDFADRRAPLTVTEAFLTRQRSLSALTAV
jgi:hypothetical protein